MSGILYIVATPIGNLEDISQRALSVLKQVDLIAAEDTRHSKTLFQRYSIETACCAYHEHNEKKQTEQLIQKLTEGQSIALISDAGTPLINDPGYKLVAAAHDNHIQVVPIPGPSALITALSASGLATDKFIYEGYPPVKTEARKKVLQALCNEPRTCVFYEAPHRITEFLKDMLEVLGADRKMTIARELTKQFEQIVRGEIKSINEKIINEEIKTKGEFVVIIEGVKDFSIDHAEVLRINQILLETLPPKEAARLTAKITGMKKNEIYKLTLELPNAADKDKQDD